MVKPEVTGEEISRIMQEEVSALRCVVLLALTGPRACQDPSRIFQQEMLGDFDNQRARQNLLFITERHKDILRLEKSIRELHQVRCHGGCVTMLTRCRSCLSTWRRWCRRRASSSTRSSAPVRTRLLWRLRARMTDRFAV